MFLSRGIEQWIRYGDHDPVQEQDVHSCTLLNNKDIRNRGDLTAEGVDVTNRGTITNDRRSRSRRPMLWNLYPVNLKTMRNGTISGTGTLNDRKTARTPTGGSSPVMVIMS